jgi:hypothetical protein
LPPAAGPRTPASARVYDWLAGGYDNYDADAELGGRLAEIYPGVRRLVARNRQYLAHAVLLASGRLGIRQFLDLGSGFPSAGSVRDHAQAADPAARVACVDTDPSVARSAAKLAREGVKGVSVVRADIRDPEAVLAHPGVLEVIDVAGPVCAVLGMVLHTMTPAAARETVAGYVQRIAPGSAVVITLPRNDDAALSGRLAGAWAGTGIPGVNYTPAEAESLFAGLEIQPPGVGPAMRAGTGRLAVAGDAPFRLYVLGGIGVKPPALRRRAAHRHLRCLPGPGRDGTAQASVSRSAGARRSTST